LSIGKYYYKINKVFNKEGNSSKNSITITFIHFYSLIVRQSCLVARVLQLLSRVRLLRRSILIHPRIHPLRQVAEPRPASSHLQPDRSHQREELILLGPIQLLRFAMGHPHLVPLQASAAQGAASALLCRAQRWSTCSGFAVEAEQRHSQQSLPFDQGA